MRKIRKKISPGNPHRRRESLAERMRSVGLRLTGQRRLLADLLDQATEHLDAESVFALARRQDPSIHRATVYRTLHTLKRLGLVDELDLMHVTSERHYYEIRPKSLHIHLVCTRCKGVEEPSGPFWENLKRRVQRESGFRPDVVRIEMGGLCASCGHRGARRSA